MQVAAFLLLAAFQPQASLDPEVAALVERLVEESDGLPLAEGPVAALLEDAGHDLPVEEPGLRRWLPTLVIRLSWSPGRQEMIVYVSWPIG